MLIIGHRGAAGLAPENTIDAFKKGLDVGADILEFDVQLTRDGVPVVIHDSTLFRTHRKPRIVRWSGHASLQKATEKGHKVATLEEVLNLCFGKVLLNLEVKNRGTGAKIARYIQENYIKKDSDWENILFSSFKGLELRAIRRVSPHAELAMLHNRNPFAFMAYHRQLQFTAVGFHRLYINPLATEVAKKLDLFIYAYTVNRPAAAKRLAIEGIEGFVTDDPARLRAELSDLV
ncbi:MAG TPA: glycerophosphodiester phosphodiesterase [Candidatus Saccharimonadales bacterium]